MLLSKFKVNQVGHGMLSPLKDCCNYVFDLMKTASTKKLKWYPEETEPHPLGSLGNGGNPIV